ALIAGRRRGAAPGPSPATRLDDAVAAASASLAICEQLGGLTMTTAAARMLAAVLTQRGRPGDVARGDEIAGRVARLAEERLGPAHPPAPGTERGRLVMAPRPAARAAGDT